MKSFFYSALLAISMTGCGSNPANVESNAAKSNNSNAPIVSGNAPAANEPNALPPISRANINAGSAVDANQTVQDVSAISRKNLERLKSKGGGDTNAAPIPAANATPFPAPDDSAISSTMNEKGIPIETRVFKNNPTLLKIERTFADIENPVTTVYLKNGKVLTMPKGAVEKPESAGADEILRAVGVKP